MKHDAWIAFGLFATLGLAVGLDEPWTDDARFYVPAAQAYADWLVDALTLRDGAWSRAGIEHAFANNREHPPVGKYVMGLGWLLFGESGLTDPVTACRIPVVLLWAWTCALVLGLVARSAGRAAGWFAALACASLPRLFFDGHAETLDLPVTTFILASATALFHYFEHGRRRAGIAAILTYTLALGTKLNAPFALAAAFAYWLWLVRPRREGTLLTLAPIPWPLLGMTALAPCLVVGLWPWLWFDTVSRLGDYLRFHLSHYPVFVYYAGHLFDRDVAPWTAPFVLTAMTTPLPILALAIGGLGRTLAGLRESLSSTTKLGLFAALQALAQLVAVALPGVPVYGGVKLFLPAMPFLCVLAGLGFHAVLAEAPLTRPRQALLAALLLLPGLLGLATYHGAWLSYFAEWTGGVRGAAARGFEQQYYDLAYPEIAEAIRAALPHGGTVAFLPNPKEYPPHMERWRSLGQLPSAIRLPPENADLLVLTHERRWRAYGEQMARYRARPLLRRYAILGVPLFSVFDLRPAPDRAELRCRIKVDNRATHGDQEGPLRFRRAEEPVGVCRRARPDELDPGHLPAQAW